MRASAFAPSGPMAHIALVALAVAGASSLFQPAMAAAKRPDSYKPIVGPPAFGFGPQMMNLVPRWNRGFQMTSSDLGSFPLFDCGGGNSSCSLDTSAFNAETAISPTPGSIIDYGEGIAMWIAITVVGLVLCFAFMTYLIIARYCFCKCCCKPNGCTCLRGGTPYPTRKQTCCGCGFILLKTGKLGYTRCDRWGAKLYMFLFVACATALLVVAEFLGTQQVPVQTVDGADNAASRVMALTTRTQPAITTLFKELGSTVVLPLLDTFKNTLTSAVDLQGTHTALQCTQAMVLDLPDMQSTSGILSAMMMLAPWMAANISVVQQQVDNIGYVKANMTVRANALKTDMVAFGTVKQPKLRTNIVSIESNTSLIQSFQDSYCASNKGPQWNTWLSKFNRLASWDGSNNPTANDKIPLSTDFDTAGLAVNNVIVVGGASTIVAQNNALSSAQAMNKQLVAILQDIQQLPDFSIIGAGLQTVLNAQIAMQNTTNATANLLSLFEETPVVSASYPNSTSLRDKLTDLSDYMQNFNLDTMRTALVNLNNSVNGLPDLDYVLVQFDKLQVVKDVLPCVKRIGDDMASINRTVIGMPDSFSMVSDLYTTINTTVSSSLSNVETIRANLLTTKTQIRSFSVNGYINDLDTAQARVNSERRQLNVTDFLGRLDWMANSTAFDFSASTQAVLAFEAIVKTFQIDRTLIASLNNVQARLNTLKPLLKRVAGYSTTPDPDLLPVTPTNATSEYKGLYLLYEMGKCTSSPGSFCIANADCPSPSETCAVLERAVSRCHLAPAICTTDTDCTNSDPASLDFCLTAKVRAEALRDALYALKENVAPVADPAPQQAQLTAVQSACSVDFTPIPPMMAAGKSRLDAIQILPYTAMVDALPSQMNAINIGNVNGVLTTAQSNINSIDFTQSKGQVDSLTPIVDDIRDNTAPLVVMATSSVGALKILMTQRWPGYQTRMNAMALQNRMNIGGPGAGFQELVAVPEDIVNYLAESVSIMSFPTVDLTNTTSSIADYINKAFGGPGFKDTTANGGIYYLSQLALADSTIRATDPNAKGIFVGRNGEKYPNDKMCLSKTCIKNTMDAVFMGNVAAASDEAPALPSAPVPLPLRWVMLILWAPIAIVILFGIWALFSPACCRKPGWQKIPSAWVAGLSLCMMPIVMIISALFFAAFMVAQDACSTGQNVGANYIASSEQSICTSTLQGTLVGGGPGCNLNFDSALSSFGVNFNVTFGLLDTYAATLGACDPDNDPYTKLITALKPVVAALPPKAVRYLMTANLGQQLKLGLALKQTIALSADNLGNVLAALLNDLNRISVKCPAISSATTGMQSDVCYTLFAPFFWYMICWYAVGWVLLFCGFPAGMLGRKRLPNGLWGRGFEEFRGTEREEIKSRSSKGSKSSAKVAPDGVNVDEGVFRKSSSSSRSSSSKDKDKDRSSKDKDKSKSPSRSSSSSSKSPSRSSSSKDKDKERSSSKSGSSSSSKDKDRGRSSSSSSKSPSKSSSSSSSKSPSKSSSSSSSKDKGSSSSSKDKSSSSSRSSSSKSPSKSGSSSSSSSKKK